MTLMSLSDVCDGFCRNVCCLCVTLLLVDCSVLSGCIHEASDIWDAKARECVLV